VTILAFVCPACRVAVMDAEQGYDCPACSRHFPTICGIPDFRIRPDRYLSIVDERAKATRLHDYAQHHDFAATVDYYYAITDDVSPTQARAFARYVRQGVDRARAILARVADLDGSGTWLDAGCGGGGALIAAQGRASAVVGVDIALRWLVIAQKRLAETGAEAVLICADIEALPFASGSFTFVIAEDLVEHAYDPAAATRAIVAQLRPGGRAFVSAINANWLGPHPAVGVWAAGWLPATLRRAVTLRLRGVDAFRNVSFVAPRAIALAARTAGGQIVSLTARPAGALDGVAPRLYEWMSRLPSIRPVLARFGPAFEIQLTTTKGTMP
jgi:2-polyprenyl-3-methyl-5-hydroxy-6-metoxy-1,4-benzoquinol methylase